MSSANKIHLRAGFSLMEVLIVLSVISVVSGIAMISVGPLWEKSKLRIGADDLRQRVYVLRMKAIMENRTYQARIQNNTLYIRKKNKLGWSAWETVELNRGVRYSMNQFEYFYSKGFASPKTILLTSGEYRQKVIININGHTRLSSIY